MRILEFDFSISHVPGKELHAADVLSRKLDKERLPVTRQDLYLDEYELHTGVMLSASTKFLDRLRQELGKDPTTTQVILYCQSWWPATVFLPPEIRQFNGISSERLLMHNGRHVDRKSVV